MGAVDGDMSGEGGSSRHGPRRRWVRIPNEIWAALKGLFGVFVGVMVDASGDEPTPTVTITETARREPSTTAPPAESPGGTTSSTTAASGSPASPTPSASPTSSAVSLPDPSPKPSPSSVPPLTTERQPVEDMGGAMARLLLAELDAAGTADEPAADVPRVFTPTLAVRDSA
jgi:hypothetical protein